MDAELPGIIEHDLVLRWRLSCRAVAVVVRVANSYQAQINLDYDGAVVNAKSIMGIFMLTPDPGSRDVVMKDGVPYLKAGSKMKLMARGPDADEAVTAIASVFSDPALDFD